MRLEAHQGWERRHGIGVTVDGGRDKGGICRVGSALQGGFSIVGARLWWTCFGWWRGVLVRSSLEGAAGDISREGRVGSLWVVCTSVRGW